MDKQMEIDRASDIRDDFKAKVKSWFENKGILNRLELYLKNQMILEFQRNCGQSIHSQSTALSPKLQAIKILVGDFLLQEDLLFSLSVYSTEVPFLLNLTQYSRYIARLSDSSADSKDVRRLPKPKFSKEELVHVLEALNLNLNVGEFDAFHSVYQSGNKGSLLTSLLGTIPKLIKKHRTLEYLLKKARRREKLFRKLLKNEKSKLKNMYAVVQKAYGIVEKHKFDVNKLLESRNVTSNDKELDELAKKENELTIWQERLELRECDLEQTYQHQFDELEDRAKTLERRELELQSKYQMLQQEKYKLEVDREHFEQIKNEEQNGRVDESDKLQEFEQKFYALQAEVREMLESYNAIRQPDVDDSKLTQSEGLRVQQTENKQASRSMNEHVNFMETENSLLKLNSHKQRNHIGQLTNEVDLLKRRLDYLEKKVEMSKSTESETQAEEYVQTSVPFFKKYPHLSSTSGNERVVRESPRSYPGSRRKLFGEDAIDQSYEFSSSNTSKETNSIDDIMADANSKVEVLENESEALDRNCRNLHNILSRNIALSESKGSGSLSYLSELSPRLSHLSGSYSDMDSPLVERRLGSSSPRTMKALLITQRSNSFRELFIKCKKERIRSNDTSNTRAESECSSTSSSPKEKIDNNAKDQLSNIRSTDIT